MLIVEEVLGATRLVLVLKLSHALDQRVKFLIGQVRHQWPNSCLQITSQCIKSTVHHRTSAEPDAPVATSVPYRAPMIDSALLAGSKRSAATSHLRGR